MFLGVLNTVFLNISYYLPHLELRNRSIQTVIITNFVNISNVGIKRFDCTPQSLYIMVAGVQSKTCINKTTMLFPNSQKCIHHKVNWPVMVLSVYYLFCSDREFLGSIFNPLLSGNPEMGT